MYKHVLLFPHVLRAFKKGGVKGGEKEAPGIYIWWFTEIHLLLQKDLRGIETGIILSTAGFQLHFIHLLIPHCGLITLLPHMEGGALNSHYETSCVLPTFVYVLVLKTNFQMPELNIRLGGGNL